MRRHCERSKRRNPCQTKLQYNSFGLYNLDIVRIWNVHRVDLCMVFNVQPNSLDGLAGGKGGFTLRYQISVQLGDGHTAIDLYGVNGCNRCHAMIEVKELVTVYEHTKAGVLAMDLHPKRLPCNEGEIRYRPLLIAPGIRNAGVAQNITVVKPYAHV